MDAGCWGAPEKNDDPSEIKAIFASILLPAWIVIVVIKQNIICVKWHLLKVQDLPKFCEINLVSREQVKSRINEATA